MPTAKNMTQLNQMLMRSLKDSMKKVNKKAKKDMQEATSWFYKGKKPVMYVRTGELGKTPKTTYNESHKFTDGGEVSFTAYLDTEHNYSTGDKPNMEQVLELADKGKRWIVSSGHWARPTVGNKEFWQRAKDNIEKDFNDTLSMTFTPK